MAKTEVYRINNPQSLDDIANQLNSILARLADRIDRLEGIRGTTTIQDGYVIENDDGHILHGVNVDD